MYFLFVFYFVIYDMLRMSTIWAFEDDVTYSYTSWWYNVDYIILLIYLYNMNHLTCLRYTLYRIMSILWILYDDNMYASWGRGDKS